MQRFSFVVLTTLLLLVMFSIGCQNDHEERIAAIETKHAEKIAQLQQDVIFLKNHQAGDDAVIDALFYKVICGGEHYHTGSGGQADHNKPLNVSLVYSDSETGTLYDLQSRSNDMVYPEVFRYLVCDGVSGGLQDAHWTDEEFDPDKHPIRDVTLTNAILVEKLCDDNLASINGVVLHYINDEILAAPGLAQSIYAMCDTYFQYMRDYRSNSTTQRAFEYMQYRDLYDRLRPPKETAEKPAEE